VIIQGQKLLEQTQAEIKRISVGIALQNTENMRGVFSIVDFDLIDQDIRHDLALLKLRKNPFTHEVRSGIYIGGTELPLLYGTPKINSNRPIDGTSIGISGYPLSETVLVTNSGVVASSWSIDSMEISVGAAIPEFTFPDIGDVYLGDIEINPGDSGAPIYLVDNASIIGLCVASKPSPVRNQNGNPVVSYGQRLYFSSGLTIIVPTRYIIELLERNKIDFDVSD